MGPVREWAYRLSRLDGDALHLNTFDRCAVFTAGGRERGDLLEHGVAGSQLTEGGVLAIEETGFAVADEELAASAVRIGGASHGKHSANVRLLVELGIYFVTRIAGAGHALGAFFGVRAAALDHEALDDTVEGRAIVKAIAGEFLKVRDGLRCDVGPE